MNEIKKINYKMIILWHTFDLSEKTAKEKKKKRNERPKRYHSPVHSLPSHASV